MALTTTANRVGFSGNSTTTVWPFTFPIPDASYLSVIYTNAAGVDTTLSSSVYSVTGIGTTTGGNVTYPLVGSPIATGTRLTLVRTVPYTQTTVFSNQGGYYPEVLEARLDLMTMEAQQLSDGLARSMLAPESDATGPGALPGSTLRATKVLAFDAAGAVIVSNQTLAAMEAGSTSAAASAAAALASQTAAATSATAAATSATAASTSATAASTSATAAATSATASAASATAGAASVALSAASAAAAVVSASNASTSATNAATSEANAGTSATASAASATTSSAQAMIAVSQANAAAASAAAAALSAAALVATSTTSLLIAVASKTFTTQTGKQFTAGQFISAVSAANNANYMHGQVTSYSATTLVVNVTDIGGSGTLGDWNLSVSGSQGSAGASGGSGVPVATATGTVNAITATYSPVLTLTNLTLCALVSIGANTSTTPTFSPDGLTARTITARGGGSLAPGDIGAAGAVVMLEYNLANTRWELLNPSLSIAANGMFVNSQTVAADYTVASGYNALSAGPITINGGVTVTVTSGSNWAVV